MSETETPTAPVQDTPKADAVETTPTTETPTPEILGAAPAEPATPPVTPETPPAPPVVPEKYDIKVPDGSIFDSAHVERITNLAKERGYTNDQAQELLDRDHQIVTAYETAQTEMIKARSQEWFNEVKSDSEVGGPAFDENAKIAKGVLEKFGTAKLRKELTESGLANHPELVRIFYRIGKGMKPDELVIPGAQPNQPKTREEIFYPKTKT